MRSSSMPTLSRDYALVHRVFCYVSLSLLLTSLAFGQITNVTDQTSTPTPGTGHDYIHMLAETVNPANGSVSVRIQVPVPKGRGLTLPFAFAYDSNGFQHPESMSNGQIEWMSNTGYLSQGGWTYSVPMLSYFSGSATYNTGGYPPQTITCYYQTAFLFQDPSAGRHALGIALANDPSPAECINAGVPTNALTSEPGFNDFFIATLSNSTVTVSDHDGTAYQFPFPGSHSLNNSPLVYSLPTFIEDRNGNKALVTDLGNGAFNIADTLGRTVISSSGFGTNGNTITVSGLSNPYVVSWGTASFNFSPGSKLLDPQDQQCPGVIPNDGGSLPAITQIMLPNGQSYQFQYDGTYGLLQKIIYPTGGYVQYAWGMNPLSEMGEMADTAGNPAPACQYEYSSYAVMHRYVSFDGQHIALQQDFNYTTNWSSTGWTTKSTTVITHDLMRPGQPSFTTVYAYAPFNVQPAPDTMSTVFAAQIPLEQTTEYYDWSGALLKTVNKTWGDQNTLMREQTALATGLTSEKDFSYSCGIIEAPSVAEYDFGQGVRGPLLRNTVMQCATLAATPLGAQIEDRPSSIVTYDGRGNRAAETDYGYDQTSVTGTSNVVGHDYANYNSSYNNRGNATSKTEWLNTSGASPVTTYTYDDTGQMLTMTDPCGNAACGDVSGSNHITYYAYTDNYSSGGGAPPGPTNAYLTQITYPNTSVGHVESFSYYYDDGQLASSTDQSGKTTTYTYNDSLARLTQINYPDNGFTCYDYDDAVPSVQTTKGIVTGASCTSGVVWQSTTSMDGVGHQIQTQVTSDPNGTVSTEMTYDGEGQGLSQSNPHRASQSPTNGLTTYTYDSLGRVTLEVPPDGAAQNNNTTTTYVGNASTVTDETGRQMRYVHDGLGRLTEADEPATTQANPIAITPYYQGGSGGASGSGIAPLEQAVQESQSWLNTQQQPGTGTWEGDAVLTAASGANAQFEESEISSATDLSNLPQTPIENIVIDPPSGVSPDDSTGPGGFPINYSPAPLPQGDLFLNVYQNPTTSDQTLTGHCFGLLSPPSSYRVDLFTKTDQFYYQGSASLVSTGSGTATWSRTNWIGAGAVLAVLYPSSVPQPASGSSFSSLPAGWIVHSNSGVGMKLTGYFARLFIDTDTEYMYEDNVPVIVQDAHHLRVGSSVVPVLNTGKATVQILYNDPVSGPTVVYDSLEMLAGLQGLPLSYDIPTNDPLYVAPPAFLGQAALQNRSFIYDDALAILAYSAAGEYGQASDIIQQLNYRIDNPGYMASEMLENSYDNWQSNWSATNGTVTNQYDPTQPPYGGNTLIFTANSAGATFAYTGGGLPDTTDPMINFEWNAPTTPGDDFVFDIGVTTSDGMVTDVQVTGDTPALPSYNSSTKTITVPIGLGSGTYGTSLENLQSLISSLTGDTLASISGFKVTLNYAGQMRFTTLSAGGLQPTGSLSFSYDVYNGNVDQAYIRTGAMAWVVYAYCMYMQQSGDYTPALYVQKMINFLETLKSPANDLTKSLYYLGWGTYQNPGYQYIPGLQTSVSTEHQADLYFAWKVAAGLLPTAASALEQQGAITSAQANSLDATASTVGGEADTIWNNVSSVLYIAPNGGVPGHFAQGAAGNAIDTSEALDASGTWTALMAHAAGDDTKSAQALEFVYQNFYLTNQTIQLSSGSNSYNETYQQTTSFSGFKPYNDSPGGYSGSPASVWQEGTWGMVDALVHLNSVPAAQSYFNSVITCNPSPCAGTQGIDTFLTTLVNDQLTVWSTTASSTTGQDAVLGYSLAYRGMPYEFEVWPMLSATSWFWITATNPTALFDPPGKPSGPHAPLLHKEKRQRLMDRIERHRKAGRQMANLRHGVVSPQRLHWRLIPAARGNSGKYRRQHKRPINGKLGPGDPPTYYTYDALNNLIQVQQPGGATDSSQWRTRTFVYDSLSRLISATNPESGTTTYTYDANGNLLTKTDARTITTTYTYDALNRLIGKTYSDGEPAVTYTYDQGGAAMNAVGRRTGMTDAAGTESWTYDTMGRVLTDQRKTNGVTKTVSYAYNLDGTVASVTYPSGRVVNYQVGGAELPTQATNGGTGVNYASSVTYAPQGAVATLALGGNINLSESYNSRLQPSAIQATAAGGANLLNLAYDFGLDTADNGDVKAIVNNRDITRTQYFDYDALNRITLANTQASTGANAWGQAFGYDPWGNLTSVTVTQGTAPALSVAVNASNQLAGSPYSYDAAGNMLTDAVNTYTWNAEGKMASVTSSLYGSANYVYDGDGHRVEKSTGKLYWYGTDGNVLAESDLSGNITDEYIFFGGRRIARVDSKGNVDYYLADSLGSARVVTDANGNILDDCDFLPLGDEQCVTSSSGNPYKFTGKERDPESQLDHFYARNYSSQYGRFVSPDGSPEPKPVPYADLSNPQTLNLYSYVANNPLRRTDPDGHGMWDDFKKLFKDPFGDGAPTIPEEEQAQQSAAQQQNSSENQPNQPNQQPSSWDKTKPLPDSPDKLGPDWKKNPDYKNPNGEEYVNDKTGEKIEWNKGRKGPWGPKADRGKDGWHYTPPGGVRGKQMDPGTVLKTAAKIGFWGTAGAITLRIIETAAEACAEGACY